MKFAIRPHPLGDYVSKHSRRVRLVPANAGTNFSDAKAFAERHDLIPVDLYRLRESQLAKIGRNLDASLDDGITVAGVTWGALEKDQNAFARLLVLFRETEELLSDDDAKHAFQSSIQVITDKLGRPHRFTVLEIRAILVAYGYQIAGLWSASAMERAILTSARTASEILAALRDIFGHAAPSGSGGSSSISSGSDGSFYSIGAQLV